MATLPVNNAVVIAAEVEITERVGPAQLASRRASPDAALSQCVLFTEVFADTARLGDEGRDVVRGRGVTDDAGAQGEAPA